MTALADRPARSPGHPAPREVKPLTGPAQATRRVLVADPCADTVGSTAWLLRAWGYDVREAGSGPEALEVARGYRPDVILMEIGLPGLDGCEVARRLRRQGAHSDVLLVAVTGYGDEKNRRRSLEAGFDCHLVKPVAPDVLQNLLATARVGRKADGA
jgi:CheY-like chemotaxis protein